MGVLHELDLDILGAGEDAFQVCPGSLDLHPDRKDRIGHVQPALPAQDVLDEVLHMLALEESLQLGLGSGGAVSGSGGTPLPHHCLALTQNPQRHCEAFETTAC